MLFGSATSAASVANKADVLKQIFTLQYGPENSLFSVFSDGTREETTGLLIIFGISVCFMLGLGLIIFSTVRVCYRVTARTCSWLHGCNPWARIHELEKREKAIEAQEVLVARQARSLVLDAEIGVCNRLLEIFRQSMTSAEDRAEALETEKELLLLEVLRDERNATEQKLVRRRLPTIERE
ncbi:hypothetical protein F5878DRAFT_646674 [Lentinula raphanica]|uniref:Uncharacterized protein n=1 Tax=Lentinula raphanica TaxID=153919 RepID=A0AA38NXQ0_9AGAR|nr:hypothetical protein F5880DRAFT_1618751 [Lentinula raphanica]KAJ3832554.1 hypothetical protein F5878DRAFT_646674 [Lentinula raphanica]